MSTSVRTLMEARFQLQLFALAGQAGLDNPVESDQLQKAGLAMTGFVKYVHAGTIQVMGNSEMSYFLALDDEEQRRVSEALCGARVAAIMITRSLPAPDTLTDVCQERKIPLLQSPLLTADFFEKLHRALQQLMAPSTSLHGVLMDVLGVGILLLGSSGIGKSECALELVYRGHRLVADDIVDIRRRGITLVGAGYELIKHHMEIRGLGIINIKDLFGIASVRDNKKIELCLELVRWDDEVEYDRLGIEERFYEILGIELPYMLLPVAPGRNVAILVEIAARNQLLKAQGHNSALDFQQRLMGRIANNALAPGAIEEVE